MKERAVLLNPPGKPGTTVIRDFYCSFPSKAGYYWPPQDLWALSGILRGSYDVRVIDAVAEGLGPEPCLTRIRSMAPRIVIVAAGAVSFAEDMRFAAEVKKDLGVTLAASGNIFRFKGKEILEAYPFLDAGIADFTDASILHFLKGNLAACTDLVYRAEGAVHAVHRPGEGEFRIGRPSYEAFLHKRSRIPLFGDRPFSISLTSFGCKFNCSFCAVAPVRFKPRDLSEVADDLRHLRALGITRIQFVDPLFTASEERTLALCEKIGPCGMEWICNAHAATLCGEGLVAGMKAAGCKAVMIGVESGDDAVLNRCAKGADTGRIERAFALCRQHKIKTLAYFMIGLPGENRDSIKKSLAFAKKLRCDYVSFGFAYPDIGSRLAAEAARDPKEPSRDLAESFRAANLPIRFNGGMTEEEIQGWIRRANRDFYLRPGRLWQALAETRSWGDLALLLKQGRELLKGGAVFSGQ